MAWIIAEFVVDHTQTVRNDLDEPVPLTSWVRRDEEPFPYRADAMNWISARPDRFLEDGASERFQARRIEEAIETP